MLLRNISCLSGSRTAATGFPLHGLPLVASLHQCYSRRVYTNATVTRESAASLAELTDELSNQALSNQAMRQGSYERELVQKQVNCHQHAKRSRHCRALPLM